MRTLFRLLMILVLSGAVLPTILALSIIQYGEVDRASTADVIIILGAGTRPNGAASAAHARRIRHGAALYDAGYAPRLLCTGGLTARHRNSEAQACINLLRELGVPEAAILYEDKSRSTEENAIYSREVMQKHVLRTALLVSDNYHLWRAERLFLAQGISVSVSPAQATVGPLHWRIIYSNMYREVAASAFFILKSALQLPVTNAG